MSRLYLRCVARASLSKWLRDAAQKKRPWLKETRGCARLWADCFWAFRGTLLRIELRSMRIVHENGTLVRSNSLIVFRCGGSFFSEGCSTNVSYFVEVVFCYIRKVEFLRESCRKLACLVSLTMTSLKLGKLILIFLFT